jgi:hypothetical protein
MKRHPALAPLSRDHHHALVIAQRLRRATTQTAPDIAGAFLAHWNAEQKLHFRLEEQLLLPAYAAYGQPDHPAIIRMLLDHMLIRRPAYKPTSDEKLQDALAALGHIGVQMHYDGDAEAMTFNFADEAAFNLAMGEPTTSNEEALQRAEIARDGGLAFVQWAAVLVRTYMTSTGAYFGEPIVIEKPKPADA